MKDRKRFIENCRAKRMTFQSIADLLNISHQRVQQIINPEYINSRGGRDVMRERVRIRDKQTCQICLRVWTQGCRKFDVHHQKEEEEGRSHERGIIKRDKKSFDTLITLCHKCHLSLDSVRNKMRKYPQSPHLQQSYARCRIT